MALAAYRTLLRSARIAFEGDTRTLLGARKAAREGFEKERHLQGEEASKRLLYVQDVARILRENVVQGQGSKEDPNKLRLRIHEHTELGDNESVKAAKGSKMSGSSCCSS